MQYKIIDALKSAFATKREFNLTTVRSDIIKTVCKTAFLGFLVILCSVSSVLAAPCDPFKEPEEQVGCGDFNPDDVPLDGGASLLVAAGVAYGLKRAYQKRKQNKEADSL